MDIDKERLRTLAILASSVTSGTWVCAEDAVKTSDGLVIARLGSRGNKLDHEGEANGEFIVEMRNAAPYLLSLIRELHEMNGRLLKRVKRLESELYE